VEQSIEIIRLQTLCRIELNLIMNIFDNLLSFLTVSTLGERARNRDRILQIRDLHSTCKDSLSSLLDSEDDEGFDEEDAMGK
jgi:hypothetical protein